MKFIACTPWKGREANDSVFYTLPDTALKQGGQPFFVPESGQPCVMRPCLAVRICRQGRGVGERFASRYYDAVTCAAHFVARGLLESLVANGLPWDEAVGFDGAVCIGQFLPVTDESADSEKPCTTFDTLLHYSIGDNNHTTTVMTTAADIRRFLSAASRHFTLHQGDIALLPATTAAQEITVEEDSRVAGETNGAPLLKFNIK